MPSKPFWLDPLNRAMDVVPESLQRGAQAVGEGIDALSPEMTPVENNDWPNIWEEQVAGRLPQGFRDFADFFSMYAGLSGFDPAGAGGKAITGLGLKTGGIGPLKDVAKSKLREGVRPLQRRLRKDRPSGASLRKGSAEYLTNPEAEFRATENIPEGIAGQYSGPNVMASRRPDLPHGAELIEVLPTGPKSVSIHEKIHAARRRMGGAQKESFKKALDSGQIPEHPKLDHPVYREIRKAKPDQYYDENFTHWLTSVLEGEVSLPSGGARPFTDLDLPAANYMREFVQPSGGRLSGPSPLAGADVDPLLRNIGPK